MNSGIVTAALLACTLVACKDVPQQASADELASAGCLAGGDGRLEATLRGAMDADIAWDNAQMECDGDLRPDGSGLRITIAGPLPATPVGSGSASASRRLRFIFGVDLEDTAAGAAQALPTNLTVIIEGGEQLYATRGSDLCAVEGLERVATGAETEWVSARGYCLGPASDLSGEKRLLVPTFSFTALVRTGEATTELLQTAQ
ncbi:MAG TPA: hypothetical protein VNQ32_10660 [Steroidobacteraceae bacterium]|nr:hypothetical protein [Steroidobacteraceae bacterium]